jgi:hypothetical protein
MTIKRTSKGWMIVIGDLQGTGPHLLSLLAQLPAQLFTDWRANK